MNETFYEGIMDASRERSDLPKLYEDLHIYLIDGIVPADDEAGFGEQFIGRWIEGESSFLFFSKPSREKVDVLLRTRPALSFLQEHHFSYDEWQGSFLDPIQVENLLIVPPWKDVEAEEGLIKILLDPGVVFGTGLHPTTTDCLKALVELMSRDRMEKILDLGTGTGILALAAARLGAKKVMAVDLNPLCVKTAERNVALNHLEDTVEVLEGKAECLAGSPADLVVANIHYNVLDRLVDRAEFQGRAWYILSGLLRSQARDIEARLPACHLKLERTWDHKGTWYTMLVRGE
jgi:ribosomal protein L11 methyltransferase